jgi:trans-2,3-dihydro-3-hydroxyanthranilate isomerase
LNDTRRYALVDVFTETPLQGNQLGVFTDGRGLSADLMQRLARELNLSETVFVMPPEQGGVARIRIFTPIAELPFAGHPVLGTAVVLGSTLQRTNITLETGIGLVAMELRPENGRVSFARMRQPIPAWEPYEHVGELLEALGVERTRLPLERYDNGPQHVYVELDSEEAVAELAPDMRALSGLGPLCTSCFSGAGTAWKSRMFAPALGVPEDPATGSAAGPLAVHLARHGRIEFGEEIEIRQGAEIGRRSLLYARVVGSAEQIERVEVAGSAVIVARGEFMLDPELP